MRDTILANATLILPGEVLRGALVLRGGKIADIAAGPSVPQGAEDCGGDMICPGLVELHTDNLERHIRPRPSVHWPHVNAILSHDGELASVGITTVFDAMRVGSILTGAGGYDDKPYARALSREVLSLRAQGALRISHFLHLRAEICSETLIDELAAFGADDRVGIVSLMDHTPGARQFRDLAGLRKYMQGQSAVSDAVFDRWMRELRDISATHGPAHEAAAVAAAKRLGAVLASHDDTTAEHVATSAGHGARIAEFPTTHVAARACRDAGIAVMMGAPNLIRGGSHSGNVAAGDLAQGGLLDILSSDYVPASLLAGAVQLGEIWGDLPRAMACVTATPAQAVGLADRGRLAVGLRGDVIRVAMVAGVPALRATYVSGRRVA
ncbi:MAG: alpha-D-ribose 1-methylphosphonate 5-triphosphate diphosphatase [Paracoccaceae bacterium]